MTENNNNVGVKATEKICDYPIYSPLHHIYPCSWNHRLSNELPRQNVREETKVFFANLLFFVVLIETIPIAFKVIKTYRRWDVDDDEDCFYELRLHLIISFLTNIYILFYSILISNFFLIYATTISLFFHSVYVIMVYRILNDKRRRRNEK